MELELGRSFHRQTIDGGYEWIVRYKEKLLLINVAWNNFRSNRNCAHSCRHRHHPFCRFVRCFILFFFSPLFCFNFADVFTYMDAQFQCLSIGNIRFSFRENCKFFTRVWTCTRSLSVTHSLLVSQREIRWKRWKQRDTERERDSGSERDRANEWHKSFYPLNIRLQKHENTILWMLSDSLSRTILPLLSFCLVCVEALKRTSSEMRQKGGRK